MMTTWKNDMVINLIIKVMHCHQNHFLSPELYNMEVENPLAMQRKWSSQAGHAMPFDVNSRECPQKDRQAGKVPRLEGFQVQVRRIREGPKKAFSKYCEWRSGWLSSLDLGDGSLP